MAITTLSGAIAGLRPPNYFSKSVPGSGSGVGLDAVSYWTPAGNPGTGVLDTTLNGVALSGTGTQIVGQIPFIDPPSGNAYVGRFTIGMTNRGMAVLCDRLWHNGGIDVTSTLAQNITSPTWPARDIAGATAGDGVLLGLEINSAMGASVSETVTIAYTNQAGAGSKSAVNIDTTTAAVFNNFYPIGLQAGDTGVQSVQSLTFSGTWTSGTVNLVAYRELCHLPCHAAGKTHSIDAASSMVQVYAGTVPFIIFVPAGARNSGGANNTALQGSVQWAWG
jgi:hypothetical protein